MTKVNFMCRKCRKLLFSYPDVNVEDSHGSPALDESLEPPCQNDLWFIPEESMPQWVAAVLEEKGWDKGKLKCPTAGCNARLGSYNFVSGIKCQCKKDVLPPIHIVRSKVDFMPEFISADFILNATPLSLSRTVVK